MFAEETKTAEVECLLDYVALTVTYKYELADSIIHCDTGRIEVKLIVECPASQNHAVTPIAYEVGSLDEFCT